MGVKDLKSDSPGKRLTQQWGILTLIHPGEKQKTITTRVTQSDIAISIADYLGLKNKAHLGFSGRSIFRKYDAERDIYFANTYNHIIGKFTKDNKLEICDENFNYGEQYAVSRNKPFTLQRTFNRRLSLDEMSDIARFGQYSNSSIVGTDTMKSRTFDFRSGIAHMIPPGDQKTLLGGQFFTIPKNSSVSVTLKGRVMSKDSSTVFLKHDLAAKSGQVRIVKYMPKELKAGDRFSATYSFYTPDEFYCSEFRVTAQLQQGALAKVILDEALLSYTIRPPTSEEKRSYFRRFDKNVGRDLGVTIMIASRDTTTAIENL